jgi:predicted ATP-grasp superfamily ATP-dependent carboligase
MTLLAEGYAMLRCLTADLKAAGHEVTVLLDSRISKLNPPLNADYTIPILDAKEPELFLPNVAKINDAVYIIAPETNQILQKLVKTIEESGKVSLNCTSKSITTVSNKANLYKFLQKNDYSTPKTLNLKIKDDKESLKTQILSKLTLPIVLKPLDGTSSNAISKLKSTAEIEAAIRKIKTYSKKPQFIAQEFITGVSASVSIISNGQKAIAISLNKQQITLASPEAESSYNGGCVPLEHPQKQKAFALAERLVEAFSGLRGYIGVDVVLGKDKVYIVDVNPRLTTSYVGLHAVSDLNVAETIVLAVTEAKLPNKFENCQVAFFEKVTTSKPNLALFEKAAKLETMIAPPFPIQEDDTATALVLVKGDSMQDAYLRLEEAKKGLCSIIS